MKKSKKDDKKETTTKVKKARLKKTEPKKLSVVEEPQDKETYFVDEHTKVILTNAKFKCTKCKRWKPASEFGLRHQHFSRGVTIRNQAQCAKCR